MDLFDLAAKITLDDSGYKNGINAARKTFSAMTKVATTAVTASGTAIVAIVKKAVDAYGEYEQLVGGVETLFSNLNGTISAAPEVLENAARAYETAGMSANQYMATVTSFSAALIAGLEGDYAAAARVSDMAIIDMADNANKMGTSMEAIRVAYAGFAKQNYTMLDNLKLGYGGTKTEMERLLADAQKITGIKYDISNLADVYEAIHVIQTELGITGTTAREAATTIQGSANAMKAAFANLMIGIAREGSDLDLLFATLVSTAETYFNNLMPVIERSILGAADLLGQLAPIIAEKVPDLLTKLIPTAISVAVSVFTAVIGSIPELVKSLWDAIDSYISASRFGKTWEYIKEKVGGVVERLKTLLGELTENAQPLIDKFNDLTGGIRNFLDTGELSEETTSILDAAFQAIETGVQFVIDNGEAAIAIIGGIVTGFLAYQTVAGIIQTVTAAQTLLNAVLTANPIGLVVTLIAGLVGALVTAYNTSEKFRNAVNELWQEYKTAWQELVAEGKETVQAIISAFADLGKKAVEWGSSIVDGIKKGLSSAWKGFVDFVTGLWDGIKSIFGGGITVPVSGGGTGEGHAIGLDYVPYNDYPARLHRGEAVLTRDEADKWRRGQNNVGNVTIVQNINETVKTPVEHASATLAYFEQARWAI